MDPKKEKSLLRKAFSQLRQHLPPERKIQAAENVAFFVQQLPKNSVVMSFFSFGSEIDMTLANQILLENDSLAFPKVLGDQLFPVRIPSMQALKTLSHPKDLSHQNFAIISPTLITHVLVPGLIFDNEHYRLGYGGGFYDRWLSLHSHLISIGVGYLEQYLPKLPRECHDVPLSQLHLC